MIKATRENISLPGPYVASRHRNKFGRTKVAQTVAATLRVFVAAENRLLREALTRVLQRQGSIEVTGTGGAVPLPTATLEQASPQLLLLTSRGSLHEDLAAIQAARSSIPGLPILLIGTSGDVAEFLHCVRAGISGYLQRDASAPQVREAVHAINAGEAVCPGPLCRALFEHVARSAVTPGSEVTHPDPLLTKREQQLVPLLAQGLSNKEIASHFHLSEATIKNHVYRIKQKVGARNRLQIAQLYPVDSSMS